MCLSEASYSLREDTEGREGEGGGWGGGFELHLGSFFFHH